MKIEVLQGFQGRLLTFYGVLMLIPMALAFYDGDASSVKAFALTSIVTVVLGLVLWRRGNLEARMGLREGFVAVAGIWLLFSFIGAFPFYLSGYIPFYLDALFEATSGFTATGATVLTDIESLPRSLLLWRSLTHWLGGMGIIVFFIILLPRVGFGAVHLFNAEVTGPDKERVSPRIRDTALLLWSIYSVLTLLAFVLLKLAGMSFFDAVNHAFSCVATGGFSTKNASIGAFDSPLIEAIVILFMFLAGVNFTIYIHTWRKGTVSLLKNTELKAYLAIILSTIAIITISLVAQAGYQFLPALRQAAFQTVSVTTTTGFVIADYEIWPGLPQMLIFFLMFIGGCSASTAGGLKVNRIVVLVRLCRIYIKQAVHPHLVSNVVLGGKIVDTLVLKNVVRYFTLFIFIFVCATLALAATGLEPFEAAAAAIATLGNAGPGFGIIGPTANYASIIPFGKIVLIACMLLGRLELLSLLILIQPEFWKSTKNW